MTNPGQKVFQAFANVVESRLGKDDEDSTYVPAEVEAKVITLDRDEGGGETKSELKLLEGGNGRGKRGPGDKSVPLQPSYLDGRRSSIFQLPLQ